jgi:hypothetical protein
MVQVDDQVVPGLLLKWRDGGEVGLVTYEIDGRVATEWVDAGRLRPPCETPRAAEPVEG